MVVVVVGAHGILGSRVVAELDRRAVPHLAVARRCDSRTTGLDLRSEAALDRLCELAANATVIYCAQVGGRDRAAAQPWDAFRINAAVPGRLATGVRRMIYVSGDYVFTTPGAKRPDSPPEPDCVYAASKVAGERAVLAAGSHCTVVRTSGLYDVTRGPRGMFAGMVDGVESPDDRITAPTYMPDLVSTLLDLGERAGVLHAVGPHHLSEYEFHQIASLQWRFDVQPTLSSRPRLGVVLRSSPGIAIRSPAEVFVRRCTEHRPTGHPVSVFDTVGVVLSGRRHIEPDSDFWGDQAAVAGGSSACFDAERVVRAYGPNPVVWRKLRSLTPHVTYVLANNGPCDSFEQWVDRYGLDKIFALTINSERDNMPKPSDAFRARINALAAGHRVQLVDDRPDIVAAAISWGWHGVIAHRTRTWPVEHYTPNEPLR